MLAETTSDISLRCTCFQCTEVSSALEVMMYFVNQPFT